MTEFILQAVKMGNEHLTSYLLEKGANPESADHFGVTPAEQAERLQLRALSIKLKIPQSNH